jgi:hypothetical protein
MLTYIAAPYSKVEDKEALMKAIAKFSGEYMLSHPGEYAMTGLFHHYAATECTELGTDYAFWVNFCTEFLAKCDKLVVLKYKGWDTSTGVAAEISLATHWNLPVEYCEIC